MKREKEPDIIRHLKWHLAYNRKYRDKKIKRVRMERFFLCGYRFELQLGLIDMVPLQRVAELVNSKPHMLFCIVYKTPQRVIDADCINSCLTLRNSKHFLAPPVFQGCYDFRDAFFYLEEDDLILLLKYVNGEQGITVLIPQDKFLEHEHGKLLNS